MTRLLPTSAAVVASCALVACGGGAKRSSQPLPAKTVRAAASPSVAPGTMVTVAGGGQKLGNGQPATSAGMCAPADVALSASGDLLIADWGSDCNGPGGNTVRKVDANGLITAVAGSGLPGFAGDGGPATAAKLGRPTAVAVDAAGNVYFSDSDNQRIREVDANGTITSIAGTGTRGHSGDGGPAKAARLMDPGGLAFDARGNLYVTEFAAVRKISPSGIITTVVGTGRFGHPSKLDLPPTPRFRGEGGPATRAGLNPNDVAIDAKGNLYIADGSWVHKVDRKGMITRVAGAAPDATRVRDGGPATSAALNIPLGVAVDRHGNLFISEIAGQRIRKIDRHGKISTVAGTGDAGPSADRGPATKLTLSNPIGIAVDGHGVLYIADEHNARIRAVRYASP